MSPVMGEVAVQDLDLLDAAFAAGEVVGLQANQEGLDLLIGQGVASDDDLEAVVVRRVVAAGEHHPGLAGQHVGGVVQGWRGHQADVADLAPGLDQALDQLLDQHRAGQATVAANRYMRLALGQALCTDGAADPVGGFGGEAFADHTSDIVGAEDAGGEVRGHAFHVAHLGKLQLEGAMLGRRSACAAGTRRAARLKMSGFDGIFDIEFLSRAIHPSITSGRSPRAESAGSMHR